MHGPHRTRRGGDCLNRKEGIVAGSLLLASFITGVFAVPEQQFLKVFVTNFPDTQPTTVTNFPKNVVMRVLDENRTVSNTFSEVFQAQLDVSQYSRVSAFYQLAAPPNLGIPATKEASLILSFNPEAISAATQVDIVTISGLMTANVLNQYQRVLSTIINQPTLTVQVHMACDCVGEGTVRVEIFLFLER